MENTDLSMEGIIKLAVAAGRMAAERAPVDAFKATERRLYAFPILRGRLEHDRERLPSLGDAARADLEERMAEDAAEIAALERALVNCAGDAYYQAMTGRYFDGLKDEYLAKLLHCSASTVGRHRKRLVHRVCSATSNRLAYKRSARKYAIIGARENRKGSRKSLHFGGGTDVQGP